LIETVKMTAYVLAVAPAVVFGAYCTVAALASRIEDKVVDDISIDAPGSRDDKTVDLRDYLRDMPKAA
jgi:hypothetical protein